MSTCSTAASAHHGHAGHARRRPSRGRLERRLRDLEQDWDAYKASRSAGPRHRRSRSATTAGTHASSAVVTAAGPDLLVLGLPLRGSPRKLVSSLQQAGGSSGTASARADGVTARDGKSRTSSYEGDASSVCSVDTGPMAAVAMAASSSSSCCCCSCECAVPCCGCGYSSSSSAAASFLSPVERGAVAGDHVTQQKRRAPVQRSEKGRAGRFAAIAAVGVVVVGIMSLAVWEFGMDEGYVEFLVPT